MTLDIYWNEADKVWDLIRLYKDLSRTKGRGLTELQKAKLRGALCSVALKDVAEQLHRGLKGLRTDLSPGLYRFIQDLLFEKGIDHNGRIYWQQIPRLLSLAGYSRQSVSAVEDSLLSISAAPLGPDSAHASEIIKQIEEQRLRNKLQNSDVKFPLVIAQKLDQDGDLSVEREDFDSAIHYYRIPVEQDLSYASFLVKIAMCFDKLHRYSDSVMIALESFTLCSDADLISKLNGVLGSAFHELAIHTRDDLILRQALDYYQKAKVRSEELNVLGIWNSFDLLIQFSVLNPSQADRYLRKAKLSYCDFLEISQNPTSNFKRYRQYIREDSQRILSELDEPWLAEKLLDLQEL